MEWSSQLTFISFISYKYVHYNHFTEFKGISILRTKTMLKKKFFLCYICLGVYCYNKTHPVIRVEILGHIVSLDVKEKLTTYGGNFHTDIAQ